MNKYAVFGIGVGIFSGVMVGVGVLFFKKFHEVEKSVKFLEEDMNREIVFLHKGLKMFEKEHGPSEPVKEDKDEFEVSAEKYRIVYGADQKPDVDEIAGRYKWEEPDEEPEDDDIL